MIPIIAKPCDLADIPPTWATLQRYDATREYTHALIGLLRAVGLLSAVAPVVAAPEASTGAASSDAPALAEIVQPAPPPAQAEPASMSEATASSAAKAPAADAPVPASAQPAQFGLTPSQPATTDPPTRIVDADGKGQHRTVIDAVKAALPGERILIRPGIYSGQLTINKPLQLIGEGEPSEVVIRTEQKWTTDWQIDVFARDVHLCKLSFQGDSVASVLVVHDAGEVHVEDCDLRSPSTGLGRVMYAQESEGHGILVQSGGSAIVRDSSLHDFMKGAAVWVRPSGTLLLEDTGITNCRRTALRISGMATVRRNRITDNQGCAIQVDAGGSGTFENNDLRRNGKGAWAIDRRATVHRTDNRE